VVPAADCRSGAERYVASAAASGAEVPRIAAVWPDQLNASYIVPSVFDDKVSNAGGWAVGEATRARVAVGGGASNSATWDSVTGDSVTGDSAAGDLAARNRH